MFKNMFPRRLRRVKNANGAIGGVCAGIAYWLGAPTWLVRLIFILAALTGGGLLVYVLWWILMPAWDETPSDYEQITIG